MTTLRRIFGKLLRKGNRLATSDDCCCGCYYDEDCPSGYECVDGECVPEQCESSADCVEGECCYEGECVSVACPAPYTVSGGWCTLTPVQYPNADMNAYPANCQDEAGNQTRYWMIFNREPDEIQSPGGGYLHPVPGLGDPAAGMCRYVWVVYVGFGPTPDPSAQPTRCQSKAYYLYLDVNRCEPSGGTALVVEDPGHDWGGWPSGCTEGCQDDLSGCMSVQPFLSITFAP